MVNLNTNAQYYAPHNFNTVLAEINVHQPFELCPFIMPRLGCKVQDHITNYEKWSTINKAEITSLNERITKVESDASGHPTVYAMARRVAATAALVLAYIVLAASIIGILFIVGIEESDVFARASKGYSPRQLEKDKDHLKELRRQLKITENHIVGLNDLKAKAPAAIQALEQRIALRKQIEAEILAKAGTNHMWYTLVDSNSHDLRQYEFALLWFRQAVLAA